MFAKIKNHYNRYCSCGGGGEQMGNGVSYLLELNL